MTNEQLRQNAAAMLAHADGKEIQVGGIDCDPVWHDNKKSELSWDFRSFSYRPKPEPVTVPWSMPAHVPGPVCWLQEESRAASACLITSISHVGVTYVADSDVRLVGWSEQEKWKRLLYSMDRKQWAKCEVTQ